MNKEEILEYNKLCAEFLTIYEEKENELQAYPEQQYSPLCSYANSAYSFDKEDNVITTVWDYCKFHSDWNWIMEVVEAIEKLHDHPNKEISFKIEPGQVEVFQRPYRLESNDYHEVIYLGDGYINNSKKEAVVQAINSFFIWYNKNK